jgi:SpoVK/Ycf46/Vps4 family AAA+-type ATPase
VPVAGRDLKQLFRAYSERDELAFRRAAQSIIQDEEAKQHLALARELRRILGRQAVAADSLALALPEPPSDRDGGWPLADIREPSKAFDDLILPQSLEDALRALCIEVMRWDELDAAGIPRRQRVLLYGPAGCGKTSAAEALAAELMAPLAIVRLDAVVSSYLGETAANLRRIFEFASSGRWVLLFDEFDALGRSRDDPSEHGEIKRMVNAVLQMLDAYRGPSLLVAATNHEGALDTAVWRRFDAVLQFPRPSVHQLRAVLRRRLAQLPHRGLDIDRAATSLKGLSHAAAEHAAWDAARRALLEDRREIARGDLTAAVADARQRPW